MENALMPLVYIQSNSTKRQNFITLTPFAVGLLDLSMDLNHWVKLVIFACKVANLTSEMTETVNITTT